MEEKEKVSKTVDGLAAIDIARHIRDHVGAIKNCEFPKREEFNFLERV